MPKYYLKHADDSISDIGHYPEKPVDREGAEWVEGEPPEGAQPYKQLTSLEQLTAVFTSLPVETQAQLGPLASSVLMFLQFNNPAAAKAVIEGADIPAELEELKQQMLGVFNG